MWRRGPADIHAERSAGAASTAGGQADRRRWYALVVVALAQLMVVVDLSIVNVALPDAQKALHISDDARSWAVTAYALAFGSLMLLGGRIADYWGRKRAFIVGMIGFAAASAVAGFSQNGAELFASRVLQGAFGALLAPASLSLLQVAFPAGKDRAKAFSVFGAVAGSGAALGGVAGGILTQYASWRWCFLVNVPVAIIAVAAAICLVTESTGHGDTPYDLPGAITATLGLAGLVYGFTAASLHGWSSLTTTTSISVAVLLLAGFVAVEARSTHPLLPLRIVLHRTRGGSFLTALLAGASILGSLFFINYYLQTTRGYTPLESGLGSLPITVMFVLGTRFAASLTYRFGPKKMMVAGAAIATAGALALTTIGLRTSYAAHVLPGELLRGCGLCALFIPLPNAALIDVDDHDAGAASGLLNATQQVGGAVGIALFTTIYSSAVAAYLASHGRSGPYERLAALHAYVQTFRWSAGAMLLSTLIAMLVIRARLEDFEPERAIMPSRSLPGAGGGPGRQAPSSDVV